MKNEEEVIYKKTIKDHDICVNMAYSKTFDNNNRKQYEVQAYVSPGYKQPFKLVLHKKIMRFLHLDEFLEFCKRLFNLILKQLKRNYEK